jgi:hypothetical protein
MATTTIYATGEVIEHNTSVEDEAALRVEQDAWAVAYAKVAYKDKRKEAYASIGDQQDMQYWDQANDTTTWADHIAAVKAAHPKPGL